MGRVMWTMVKEKLVIPYLDLNLIKYDLSIQNRDFTDNQVTTEAANACLKHNVGYTKNSEGFKFPNGLKSNFEEHNLKNAWPSPNGTIRSIIDGTIYREPIIFNSIKSYLPGWKSPIIVARHGFGDLYNSVSMRMTSPGKLYLYFEPENGNPIKTHIASINSTGVGLGMYNIEESIENFAHNCFNMAIERKMNLHLGTKNTIARVYDDAFVDIFKKVFTNYAGEFDKLKIEYSHMLIDDLVARAVKLNGNFIWACKNYDGDVQSDFVGQGFGSLGLISSVIVSPNHRTMVAEVPHGTVSRHYKLYLEKKPTSTNPIATIFTWISGIKFRARFDGDKKLNEFASCLEAACRDTVETDRIVTRDLMNIIDTNCGRITIPADTSDFIDAVRSNLDMRINS